MPSPHTFEVAPIAALLARWVPDDAVSVDPFAGRSRLATHRNDLNPSHGQSSAEDAISWLNGLSVVADVALLDPPYSPRQVAECYQGMGVPTNGEDTQTARLYREAKERLAALLRPGGVAITFGWSSVGFGEKHGFRIEEILLVCHGGAHNDTICVVERKMQPGLFDVREKGAPHA